MPSASRIAHAGLLFANPMSAAAVDAAARALPLADGATVLETGCGGGEVLVRVLEAHPGAHGVGIDVDPDAVDEARARERTGRARFEAGDAAAIDGRFGAIVNVGASHVHGGFPDVLGVLRPATDVVLYGEGFWRHTPSSAFLEALGGASAGELSDLDGLRAACRTAGLAIEHESIATDADWAYYEETLADNAERDGGPQTAAFADRIRRRRAVADGTDTLGFALLVLRAQDATVR